MMKLKRFNLGNIKCNRYKFIFIFVILSLVLSIGIPSLARYRNRNTLNLLNVWDGSVASSYRDGDGSSQNPYIISNGAELAYLSKQLETTDYAGKYFKLKNDIVINDGIFSYNDNNIEYILNDTTYYLKPYTNEYYLEKEFENKVDNINIFTTLNNFKGIFDGNSYTIYGLYISDDVNEQVALFTNLNGKVEDLYVENAFVYGGNITSGVAAVAENSEISNILFDGNVIGKDTISKSIKTLSFDDISLDLSNEEITHSVEYNVPFIYGEISNITLSGEISLDNTTLENTQIYINEQLITETSFEMNLSNSLDEIIIRILTVDEEINVSFTNLTCQFEYKYASSAGIVGISNNTTIMNVINKGYIYSYLDSAGIVSNANNTNLSNSYNIGNIVSTNNSAGLINRIKNSDSEILISKSYNAGSLIGITNAGLVNEIVSSNEVTIKNCFDINTSYLFNKILEAIVNIENSYHINTNTVESGNTNGDFIVTTLENLKNKEYLIQNLSYDEFVDFDTLIENSSYIWVYEDSSFPILYIDDILNPVAHIYAGTYSWNNLGYELNTINFGSKITFSIMEADALKPLQEVYYYISNSKTPLNRSEIESITEWNTYTEIQEITEEGFYVIYAKIIDYNENVSYLNTDLLVLDLSEAQITISMDNRNWNNFKTDVGSFYIDTNTYVNVGAIDELSGVATVHYYLSSEVISKTDLEALDESKWIIYNSPILLSELTDLIVYVRAIDNCGIVTYANTDYIVFNGYSEGNLTIGRNTSNTLNNVYISNKSTITMEFSYNDRHGFEDGYTHNLISSILLPVNSIITLIDKNNGNIYSYEVDTSDDIFNYNNSCIDDGCIKFATYPLSLFKNKKVSVDEYFNENDYYATSNISENFKVVLDLSKTNFDDNYDSVYMYMNITDANGDDVRTTLKSTLKTFNIYSYIDSKDTSASLYMNASYDGEFIEYNSDSTSIINVQAGLNYSYINGNKIYDTTNENKNVGIKIKFTDEEGNLIAKKYLKNIILKLDDKEYAAESDGIFRISLNSGIENINKNLVMVTHEDNIKLKNGNYNMIINSYIASDGVYTTEVYDNEFIIPVVVSNSSFKINYIFNVIESNSKIISKKDIIKKLDFSVIQSGDFVNPIVRVSLYEKSKLTAYDQEYTLVDLKDYVTDELESVALMKYYAIENPKKYNGYSSSYNPFELNLVTSELKNTAYKLVFELYDGENLISTIENKFIVR